MLLDVWSSNRDRALRKKSIRAFTFLLDVVHFYIASSEAQNAGAQQGAATNSSSRDVTRLAGSPSMAGGVAGFSHLLLDES